MRVIKDDVSEDVRFTYYIPDCVSEEDFTRTDGTFNPWDGNVVATKITREEFGLDLQVLKEGGRICIV